MTTTPKKRGRPAKVKEPVPESVEPVSQETGEAQIEYTLTVKIGNETYTGSGNTLLEALRATEQPKKILTKGIVRVSYGDVTRELLYMPFQIRRLFYPNSQVILAKVLSMGLK